MGIMIKIIQINIFILFEFFIVSFIISTPLLLYFGGSNLYVNLILRKPKTYMGYQTLQ